MLSLIDYTSSVILLLLFFSAMNYLYKLGQNEYPTNLSLISLIESNFTELVFYLIFFI